MATLIITGDDGSQRTVELGDRDLRIGRAAENDLVLGDATKGVSRMHAEIRFERGRYVIIDLNSQNGTWLNGERVQRADIPPDGEVTIGAFRLSIRGATAAAPAPPPAPPAAAPDATMIASAQRLGVPAAAADAASAPAAVAAKAQKRPPRPAAPGGKPVNPGLIAALARMPKPMLFGGFFAVALIIVVIGQIFAPGDPSAKPSGSSATTATKPAGETNEQIIARHLSEGRALVDKGDYEAAIRDHFDRILLVDPNHAEAIDLKAKAQEKLDAQRASAAAAAAAAAAATPAPAAASSTIPPPSGSPAATTPASATSASTVPPASGAAPAAKSAPAPAATPAPANARAATAAPPRGMAAADSPVPRNPGESVQAWRARSASIQKTYAAAHTALDQGDFGAAAAGFDAVLKDAPGFLDAPQLLVKAREGQRSAARANAHDLVEAGNQLDASGDLTGAMQKYSQAAAIDPSAAGLDDATKRVREKMRVAGGDAFKRARQFDALGRTADALKEYQKAADLLPPDDPNRKVARDRADQLKGAK